MPGRTPRRAARSGGRRARWQSRKTSSAWLPMLAVGGGRGAPSCRCRGRSPCPGVPSGRRTQTRDWWGRPSGLVSANTRTMSATEALVMNHLWPSITHSSPSLAGRRADDGRIRPRQRRARSGRRRWRSRPAELGHSQRSFCASVAPWASSSMFPLSGACTPKIVIDIMQRPMISDIRASLSWPSPSPPSFGSRKAPHRPWALTWSWRCDLTTLHSSAGSSSKNGFERDQLAVDEGPHPGELLLELWLRLEVPCHLLLRSSDDYGVISP